MNLDKKKLFALLLFLIMGLFMFTSANPGTESTQPVSVPSTSESTNNNNTLQPTQNTTNNNVVEKKDLTDNDLGDFSFADLTVTYDGKTHSITATNIPDYVTVTYDGNDKTDAGTYTVTVTITAKADSNYKGSLTKTATLTIDPATVKIDWTNTEFTYDGNNHKPDATYTDVDGKIVTLDVTGEQSAAGTYTAATTIADANYKADNLTSDFTINKKQLTREDLGDLTFNDKTVTYDGTEQSVVVNIIPKFDDVTYTNNTGTNAGTYNAKATVTAKEDSNYTGSVELNATLTINPKEVEIAWVGDSFVFNNAPQAPTASYIDVNNNTVNLTVTGARTDVGTAYVASTTITDGNYTATNTTHNFDITKKTLEDKDLGSDFAFANAEVTYDGQAHSIIATGAPEFVTITYTGNADVDAGTYTVTATITAKENSNYTGSLTKTATLTIDKRNVEVTIDNKSGKYLDSLQTLTYTITSGTEVTSGEAGIALSTTATATSNVGTYSITGTFTNTKNYNVTFTDGTYTIAKKDLTKDDLGEAAYNDATVTYNTHEQELTMSNVPTWATVTYENNKGTNVGTYNATATVTANENSNYTGSVTYDGTLTIVPATVTINWVGDTFVFNNAEQTPSASYVDLNGTTINLVVTGAQINVGTGYVASTTITDGNYTATNTTHNFDITKKTLEDNDLGNFTFANAEVTYDGTAHSIYATNIPTYVDVTYTGNANVDAGTYTVTATITAKENSNYTGSLTKTATLTINKRNLVVTIDSKSGKYLDSLQTLTYKITSGTEVTSGEAGITLSTTATATSEKGNYPITGTYTNTKNYNVAFTNGTYAIGKKDLTDEDLGDFTFDDATFTYDGNTHSLTAANVPAYVTVTYANNGKVDAGTYIVTATITANADSNYTGSLTRTATLKINPATVTIDWTNTTFTYDGSSHKPTATFTDVKNSVVELKVTGEKTDAGTYTATAVMASTNYVASNPTTSFTINKKTLEDKDLGNFTFNNDEVTYDGNEHSIYATNIPNFVDVTYTGNADKDAGTYTVTATITAKAGSNYTGSLTKTATLKIDPKTVTIDWTNTTFTYDGNAHKPTATYKDITGTVVNLDVTDEQTDAGTYTANTTVTDPNYTATNTSTQFTINKKNLTDKDLVGLTFNDLTVTYDGTSHTITANNVPDYVTISYTGEGTDAGTYTVTATVTAKADSNYTGSVTKSATLTINPKEVTINWVGDTYQYDGNAHKPSATYTDINNNVVVLETTGAQTDVGTGYVASTTVTESNYTAKNTTHTFDITKKQLDKKDLGGLTFNGATFTYDEESHSLVATNVPDFVTVTYTNNGKTNVSTYEVTATVTAKAESNYTGSVTYTANLVINPFVANVTWTDNANLVYDGTNKMPTATAKGAKGEDLTLTLDTNSIVNAGTYTIKATLNNANYTLNNDTHTVVIAKADPAYTIPTGLEIYEDQTVSAATLPEGFTYNNPDATAAADTTINTTVTYTPADTTNYNTITDIPVDVKVVKRFYTVRFLDYYGHVLTTESVRYHTGATAPTTGYAQDITLSNSTVLTGPTWDKDYSNITSDLDVNITYKSVASAYTTAYLLKDGRSVPNPVYAPNDSSNYDTGVTNVLIKDDANGSLAKVVAAAKVAAKHEAYLAVGDDVYNYITTEGLAKINTLTGSNYSIVWYVLKYNSGDGWHLDGYRKYNTTVPTTSYSLTLSGHNLTTKIVDSNVSSIVVDYWGTNKTTTITNLNTTTKLRDNIVYSVTLVGKNGTNIVYYNYNGTLEK